MIFIYANVTLSNALPTDGIRDELTVRRDQNCGRHVPWPSPEIPIGSKLIMCTAAFFRGIKKNLHVERITVLPAHKLAALVQRNRAVHKPEQYLFPGTLRVSAITQPTCLLLSAMSTNRKEHPMFPEI